MIDVDGDVGELCGRRQVQTGFRVLPRNDETLIDELKAEIDEAGYVDESGALLRERLRQVRASFRRSVVPKTYSSSGRVSLCHPATEHRRA